jgi:hypothetical protein
LILRSTLGEFLVPALPPVVSVAGDIRRETALEYLPALGKTTEEELMLACDRVTHADAWSGASLRALVEYAATWLGMPVTVALPGTAAIRSLLATLMGDLPNGATLPDGAKWPESARSVLLPGSRIENSWQAEQYANAFATVAGRYYSRREITFLAAALGVLLDNALVHGGKSPVGAITAIAHEREDDELQVVVCDLSEVVSRRSDASEALATAWATSEAGFHGVPGGLVGLATMAGARDFDVTIALTSGSGRLRWRAGEMEAEQSSYVPGFTAAVTLHRGAA